MKKLLTKICVMLSFVLVVSSLEVCSVACAANPDAEALAMAFIETVLPVDLSQYNVTLDHHSVDEGSPIAGITGQTINRVIDNLRYILDSDESTLTVSFAVQNNVVKYCHVSAKNGLVVSDRQYTSLLDAVTALLEKYQNYSNIDSTELIAMLDGVDVTQNVTTTVGNTKLTISQINKYGIEQTSFDWAYTENGAEYTSLQISYQNGNLYSLRDDRAIYTIGDTSINISKEQAIDIAMNYIPNYSYKMPYDVTVSGFNITEDRTTATLFASPIDSTELRPYWSVQLYLNQTYPGSVKGLTLYIWAKSGEVFYCGTRATGGAEYDDPSDTESTTSDVDSSLSVSNPLSTNTLFAIGIAVTVIGIATASVVILKKRKK
jgi:hypothetical protein